MIPERSPGFSEPGEDVLEEEAKLTLRLDDGFDDLFRSLGQLGYWQRKNLPQTVILPGEPHGLKVSEAAAEFSVSAPERRVIARQAYLLLRFEGAKGRAPSLQLFLQQTAVLDTIREKQLTLRLQTSPRPGETLVQEIIYPTDHYPSDAPEYTERVRFLLGVLAGVQELCEQELRILQELPGSHLEGDQVDLTDITELEGE